MKKLIIIFIFSLLLCDNQIIKSVELDSLSKDTLSQKFCKGGKLFKHISYSENRPFMEMNLFNLDCNTDITNVDWTENLHGDFIFYMTDYRYPLKKKSTPQKVITKGQFDYGVQIGKWKTYYNNQHNSLKSEGYYCNSGYYNWDEDGKWIYYNEDGSVEKEVYYKCQILGSEILEFNVLTSINVPPLKSIPRFKPFKVNNNIEIKTKDTDIYIINFLILMNS